MAKLPTDVSAAALSAALAAPAVEKDEFADAFAKFSLPADAAPEPTPAVVAAEAGAEGAPAKVEGETPPTEIEGAPAPAAGDLELSLEGADASQKGKQPEPAPKQPKVDTQPDPFERLADLITQRDKPQPQPQPQQPQTQPLYSAEDAARITNYYKEWPEVAEAHEVILRGAMTQMTNHIFAEIARTLAPRLQLLDQVAGLVQHNELVQAVPGYDEALQEQVSAWVEKQPKYLQAAYSNVMQNGTVDEINDLVGRYRQATGTEAPLGDRTVTQERQAPSPPAQKQATPLSSAAKKAAAALAPVDSKRTTVANAEPQTFDDAFEHYAGRKTG